MDALRIGDNGVHGPDLPAPHSDCVARRLAESTASRGPRIPDRREPRTKGAVQGQAAPFERRSAQATGSKGQAHRKTAAHASRHDRDARHASTLAQKADRSQVDVQHKSGRPTRAHEGDTCAHRALRHGELRLGLLPHRRRPAQRWPSGLAEHYSQRIEAARDQACARSTHHVAPVPEESLGPDRRNRLLHHRSVDGYGPEDLLRLVHDRAEHSAGSPSTRRTCGWVTRRSAPSSF